MSPLLLLDEFEARLRLLLEDVLEDVLVLLLLALGRAAGLDSVDLTALVNSLTRFVSCAEAWVPKSRPVAVATISRKKGAMIYS